MQRLSMIMALLLVAALAACSGDGSADRPATTTQAATTTMQAVESSGDPVTWPEPGEPWDLLFMPGWEPTREPVVAELYRQRAEEELGVEVRLHETKFLLRYAYHTLGHIRGDRYPYLDQAVRESEIIVVTAFPERSDEGHATAIDDLYENCFDEASAVNPQPPDPDLVSSDEFWQPYRVLLEQIYDEIWRLRENVPTVVIATDEHDFWVTHERQAGIEEEAASPSRRGRM